MLAPKQLEATGRWFARQMETPDTLEGRTLARTTETTGRPEVTAAEAHRRRCFCGRGENCPRIKDGS